jgi:hypothetical protein
MPPFDPSPASPLKLFLEFKGRIINISDISWADFKMVGDRRVAERRRRR